MSLQITAIILAKNEEKNIVDCLESVCFCDEIIVIDDNSEDRTVEVIEDLKNNRIKIYKHDLNEDFSKQRNFGLEKAKGEWAFFVDADERVPTKLKNEIIHLTRIDGRLKQLNGYFIKRRDIMWGRELKYGEMGKIKLLRLAKKDAGKWEGKVHEKWRIKGSLGELKNLLVHYPHQAINDFLSEINFYSNLRAKELYTQGKKVFCWVFIILYPVGKFLFNYILKRGFLDGIPGLIVAIIMSFHSFLVRAKLWLLCSH